MQALTVQNHQIGSDSVASRIDTFVGKYYTINDIALSVRFDTFAIAHSQL